MLGEIKSVVAYIFEKEYNKISDNKILLFEWKVETLYSKIRIKIYEYLKTDALF